MSETKNMLEREVQTMITNLSIMDGEEKSKAVDDLTKMYRLLIDEKKIEVDETEMNSNRTFKRIIDVAGIAAPMIFYSAWMIAGFHYEKNGTLSSDTFRQFTKSFKPFNFK